MHFHLEECLVEAITIQPFTNLLVPQASAAGQPSTKNWQLQDILLKPFQCQILFVLNHHVIKQNLCEKNAYNLLIEIALSASLPLSKHSAAPSTKFFNDGLVFKEWQFRLLNSSVKISGQMFSLKVQSFHKTD